MDTNERQLIDGLFDRLRQVDGQAPQRDGDAEQLIRQRVGAMPAAPYYMAQAILVQEQALAASQQRIEELERDLASRPAGGGFLGGLFGAPSRPAAPPPATAPRMPTNAGRPGGPWGGGAGGGFMAGAMQTAMGVAGGMLVANAIGSMFAADPAAAATPPADAPPEEADAGFEDVGMDEEW
ncbi:MAG TPA: DUF2076 family protein [Geminicoccaceae bacterium]|nr:DUF2076 family protein [Geminicoccus sp.]HMU52101.1 DUF2076 family protein [Geminicoccaceae bacterium]